MFSCGFACVSVLVEAGCRKVSSQFVCRLQRAASWAMRREGKEEGLMRDHFQRLAERGCRLCFFWRKRNSLWSF